jgi:hypothetical protein
MTAELTDTVCGACDRLLTVQSISRECLECGRIHRIKGTYINLHHRCAA